MATRESAPVCPADLTRRALLQVGRSVASDESPECLHQRKADAFWMRLCLTDVFTPGDILRSRRH